MATYPLVFTLSFYGDRADNHEIDFYDVAQALIGFQRSLALTTHLVLNDEIITQSPSLKGAQILALPPEDGSWKTRAAVIGTIFSGAYLLGTAPHDTPIGNLICSAYDYVISETLGFHVDYKKTLFQQYEETHKDDVSVPKIHEGQLDSLAEKCEVAIRNMHRPIVASNTAQGAILSVQMGESLEQIGQPLSQETFEYIDFTKRLEEPFEVIGRISSYNLNTFKGRIFVPDEGRPIAFELGHEARDSNSIRLITNSLAANAQRRNTGDILCTVLRNVSRTGRLKSYVIMSVSGI